MPHFTHDQDIVAALRAAKFGSLTRLFILRDAEASQVAAPDFYSELVAKLSALSDSDIERIAMPLVHEHLSPAATKVAVEFFSTQIGDQLAHKLCEAGELTNDEANALAEFAASEEGAKFLAVIGDPLLFATIVKGIGENVPY